MESIYKQIDDLSKMFLRAYRVGKFEYVFVGEESSELRARLRTLVASLDEEDEQNQGREIFQRD